MAPDWLGKDMLETLKLAQVLLVLVPPLRTSSPYHLLVIGCTLPTRILTKATELNCVDAEVEEQQEARLERQTGPTLWRVLNATLSVELALGTTRSHSTFWAELPHNQISHQTASCA